jgi:hypothetical protein
MKSIKYIAAASVLCILSLYTSCKKADKNVAPPIISAVPQKMWQEHWLGHNDLLTRTYYDDEITVYVGSDADSTIKWYYPLMNNVWKYVKKTYGDFGSDKRLNVIIHGPEYLGENGYFLGGQVPYLDSDSEYKNLIDISAQVWTDQDGLTPAMIHETGHIVEGASDGVKGSPAFDIWKDSKWMDMYIYDVYLGLGMDDKAKAWYDAYQTDVQSYPREGTYWFKDWWYPIYSNHGQTALLVKYFKLLADNFPKNKTARAYEFTRRMNMGEFIHFWSGAAGVNLKAQATIAFGWTQEWEQELKNAQEDFPNVKYNY